MCKLFGLTTFDERVVNILTFWLPTGMSLIEIEELINEGFRSYFTKLWNLMDILMLLILTSSFACRLIAYQHVSFID